jgi:hypothetical protein
MWQTRGADYLGAFGLGHSQNDFYRLNFPLYSAELLYNFPYFIYLKPLKQIAFRLNFSDSLQLM